MGQGCILESLRKFLSSGLRQEEGGKCSKEWAEAENEKREDRRELGQVDHLTMIFIITWTLPSGSLGHRGREEDGDAAHNLTEGNLTNKNKARLQLWTQLSLTPCPRITVGKISLLYWRQMKYAPFTVIRPISPTVRLTLHKNVTSDLARLLTKSLHGYLPWEKFTNWNSRRVDEISSLSTLADHREWIRRQLHRCRSTWIGREGANVDPSWRLWMGQTWEKNKIE